MLTTLAITMSVGMCGIDFFHFGFVSLLEKSPIWFGMSLVQFGYYSYLLLV